jgi:hypothetical protein
MTENVKENEVTMEELKSNLTSNAKVQQVGIVQL